MYMCKHKCIHSVYAIYAICGMYAIYANSIYILVYMRGGIPRTSGIIVSY